MNPKENEKKKDHITTVEKETRKHYRWYVDKV